MEPDRYQQNGTIFIIGLISLIFSLSLFALSFYILPFLLWSWSYSVPGIVLFLREWYKEGFNFSDSGAAWMVFFTFMIPALICGFISQYTSNYIDSQIYGIEEKKEEEKIELKREVQESVSFGLKVFFLIVLVVLAVLLIEWLVAPPSL